MTALADKHTHYCVQGPLESGRQDQMTPRPSGVHSKQRFWGKCNVLPNRSVIFS